MGVTSRLLGVIFMGLSCLQLFATNDSNSKNLNVSDLHLDEIKEAEVVSNRLRDSLALVDFHTQAGGANWFLKWDLTAPMWQWAGVTLDASGCVTCLDLDGQGGCSPLGAGNGLTGNISPRLGELSNLEHLYLGNNRMTGPLPRGIFDLPNLLEVDLMGNELIGPLPANIGNASNITDLMLSGNDMTGPLPASLGQLKNLEHLYLDNNRFTGPLPATIGEATNLINVRLNNNEMTGPLPASIGNLQVLESFNMAENDLTGPLPSAIGQLQELEVLILTNNKLSEVLPEELGDCSSLKVLRIGLNEFTGPLPARMCDLTNLEEFWANSNQFIGPLPAEFGDLESLISVNLSQNHFIGPLPSDLVKLDELQELIINNNEFNGPLPSAISQLVSIEIIRAQNNNIIGPLPSLISELNGLTEMNLSNNKIDGNIPETYGMVESMDILNLSNNNLSGCFPESLRDKCDRDYSFDNNTRLPWEGDFSRFCAGLNQKGADCSSDPNIQGETIQDDCNCAAFSCAPVNQTQDLYICGSNSVTIGGIEYFEPQVVKENLVTAIGCDSVMTTNLLRLDYNLTTRNATCEQGTDGAVQVTFSLPGQYNYIVYDVDNTIVTQGTQVSELANRNQGLAAGSYRIEISESQFACNIVEEFEIRAENYVAPVTQVNRIICQNESIVINGTTYDASNTEGTEHMVTETGCDSILTVSVKEIAYLVNVTDAGCGSDPLGQINVETNLLNFSHDYTLLDGQGQVIQEVKNGGPAFLSERNLAVGDYTLIVDTPQFECNYEVALSVADAVEIAPTVEEYELCSDEEIEVYGTSYSIDNASGQHIFQARNGCDSIVYINLSFFASPEAVDDLFQRDKEKVLILDILENDIVNEQGDFDITITEMEQVTDAFLNEDFKLVVEIDENYEGISTVTYEICNLDCNDSCVSAIATISKGDGYDEAVLTPNQDGYNDVLVVIGYSEYQEIAGSTINVVNRWGQIVYSAENYKNDWTGDLDGNPSKPLPEGVYYYHLILDSGQSVIGSRSLIR